jgi:osmotically-inducible protein OsmY
MKENKLTMADNTTTDAEAVKKLRAALTERLHLDLESNPIDIKIEDEAVVIEGTVDDIAIKKRAVLLAMGIDGVDGVVDRLRVRPSSTMSDAEIERHITDAFDEENTLARLGLEVEVNDGVVDLEGSVPSLTHKRLAGVLAWWIPGSVDVINSLVVTPDEEDGDGELTDGVLTVLEKDHLVNSGSVSVASRDWVVTLFGTAGCDIEKKAIEHDAWYVWGVNEVVNNIST